MRDIVEEVRYKGKKSLLGLYILLAAVLTEPSGNRGAAIQAIFFVAFLPV